MKFKLIKPMDFNCSAMEQILINRGIPKEQLYNYTHASESDINTPLLFGESNLKRSLYLILRSLKERKKAIIIVDSDCDGFTSSALFINYFYNIFPFWVKNLLTWYIHEEKTHGLKDCVDYIIKENYSLVICPDSSSNDYEEHKRLKEHGIDTIVLDHHKADHISEDATIINNQLSSYPNKFLSGVGVVWQFCRYVDSYMKTNFSQNYLDLVALGNMADMMSMTSLETKYLINTGFQSENLKNPFIYYMSNKNKFSLGDHITPMGAAFYIAPFVNAITRSGELQEKEIVFKSMLEYLAYEKVPSTKRGHKIGDIETIVEQAIRIVTNVKNRQTRSQDAGIKLLENKIEQENLLNNKVLMFLLEPGEVDKNIAGLIANKFMAKYQRPCCVLTKNIENKNGKNQISYQGSARGCDKVGVTNFKGICEKTGSILYAEGHPGAFGLGIEQSKIKNFINSTNSLLSDISDEAIYQVDYIFEDTKVNPQIILDIADMKDFWGKDVEEPLIAISNLIVTKDMITLMSPDSRPTLKISLPNGVSLIKFKSSQEEYDSLYSEGGIKIDVIGLCNANSYNGKTTPQIIIEDYDIIGRVPYVF